MEKRKDRSKEKTELHPRNRHRAPYDFEKMVARFPELQAFTGKNPSGQTTINFFDPEAVKTFSRILLRTCYDIKVWDIPQDYLCPAIPGRADYIHYLADLLAEGNSGKIPIGKNVRCLDVGVGANCIYPIVGVKEYGWRFVGADADSLAIKTAETIVKLNPALKGKVDFRKQSDPRHIFRNIILPGEHFDLTLCNPPFHSSKEEAESKALRKFNNLTRQKNDKAILNFSGQSHELWYEGGEPKFIQTMIMESAEFPKASKWFTTLVSKKTTLEKVTPYLEKAKVAESRIIQMGQGNKVSRILAWRF